MSCSNCNRLCNRLVISTAVTFTDGALVINIPQGNYSNKEKYCIVVAQTIPETTTITAPVVITIGTDTTTTYPLTYCDGTAVLACSINTRTRYATRVRTDVTGGTFTLLRRLPCSRCTEQPASLPLADAADAAAAAVTPTVEPLVRTVNTTAKTKTTATKGGTE